MLDLSRIRFLGLGLGVFVNPGRVCPGGKCPDGWELYCGIWTPRNPNVCVARLKKEFAKKARKKGECVYVLRQQESGETRTCTASDLRRGKRGCKPGPDAKIIARECPPQRRREEYDPGLLPEGTVRALKKKKKNGKRKNS